MNLNNNIIIILLVIVILVVFIFFTNSKEKFVDTISMVSLKNVTDMDDKTAINTLAQISKSLMTGGLTIPGDVKITGKTTIENELTVNSIKIGKYKLSYDSDKDALMIDNGVNTVDKPSIIFVGNKCKLIGKTDGVLAVNGLYTTTDILAEGKITSNNDVAAAKKAAEAEAAATAAKAALRQRAIDKLNTDKTDVMRWMGWMGVRDNPNPIAIASKESRIADTIKTF
jgi:hypothetical protein